MSFEFSNANPCRVVIADKSSGVRSLVRRVLDHAGAVFIIDEVDTVQGALDRADAAPINLMFIGDNIGPGKGLDVIRDIGTKGNGGTRGNGLRSVLMVERITSDLLKKGRAAGVGIFLPRPFYPAQVEHAFDFVFDELDARAFEPLSIDDLEEEMVPVTPDDAEYIDFRKAAAG